MKWFFSRKPKKVTKILLIVVSSSCISPKSLLASGRVVNSSGLTKIDNKLEETILNDSAVIVQNSPGNARLEINNFGLIKSNNAQAIYSAGNSSELLIDNSGVIEGKTVAIHVVARKSQPTDNILKQTEIVNKEQGTIKGLIFFAGDASLKSSITNSGTIIGDLRNASSNEISITNEAGAITGNIHIGSNGKSLFILNGGSINGNLTSGNSSQSLNFNGGTFNGNVSLVSGSTLNLGNSEINGTVNGNISLIAGSGLSGVSKISGVVNGNMSLLSQSSLSLGNTKVNGTINSSSSGTNKINTISTTTILNDSAAIVQNSPGNARLEINNFGLIKSNNAQAIYSAGNSSELLIDNSGVIEGKTVAIHVAARSLEPTDNILKQTEVINKEQGTIKGSIFFAGNAGFKSSINNSGTIIGDIDSRNASSNEISITNEAGAITGNIYLGSNSKSSFSLNGGSINGNLTSGNSSQSLNFNGGTFNGDVSLVSASTLNLGNSEVNGTLDISLNSILNLKSSDIKAKNISLNGIMNFGDTSKNIVGNVAGSGNATFNFGSSSHDLSGDLSLKSGDNINIDLASDNNFGKLKVSGTTVIDSNANLNVTISSSYKFIADGTKYVIIDGENGSSISAINDSNININNSSSNKFSLLTFNTTSVNNDLVLNAKRKSAETITSDKTSQNAYNLINEIGSSATGELRSIQEYLDNSTNMFQVTEALNSIAPQEKNSIKFSQVNVINSSVKTAENRMDEIHFASLIKTNEKISEANYNKNETYSLKKSSGISLGDSFENNAIWAQTFGTAAKQDNINQNDGYSSQSLGFAFGYDKEVTKNTRLGLSLSYANSNIKSSDSLKKTDIDTYQINAYSGYSFGKYFFDSIIGFAWNDYNSKRVISAIDSVASSKYNGQTYITKLRVGFVEEIGSGFNITPESSINFVRNNTDNYFENGSGTLNLAVKGNSSNFLEGRLGLNLGHRIKTKNKSEISSKISISYGYNFLNKQLTTTANFVGQTATFNSLSSKIDPKSLKLGAGFDIYGANSFIRPLQITNLFFNIFS